MNVFCAGGGRPEPTDGVDGKSVGLNRDLHTERHRRHFPAYSRKGEDAKSERQRSEKEFSLADFKFLSCCSHCFSVWLDWEQIRLVFGEDLFTESKEASPPGPEREGFTGQDSPIF